MRRISAFACAATAALGLAGGFVGLAQTPAKAQSAAASQLFAMSIRRLTESQYRHIIAAVFGPGLQINARFEPEMRDGGLQAVGNSALSVTSSGFEQYFSLASAIAAQVVDAKHRDQLIPCKPADAKAADAACTRAAVEKIGQGLFRRPLTESEIAARVKIAAEGTAKSQDYYDGLRLAVASLLVDPEFLFRVEGAEPDPNHPGQYRLDGYAKASRLSFLLWDTGPDAELLAAAKSGDIHKDEVLNAQIARMVAAPQAKDGARAFFTDMLQFENFDSLTKDLTAYPKFSQKVADSAREQTLRTIIDLLIDENRDYRDLFTSNETEIDRTLAAVYNVPYLSKQAWSKYTFPDSSERSGVLTQVTFLSLFSHPAASSPTKRGVKLHEIFFCQPTPDPPANVDFSKVQAIANGTVRTRLEDHMTNPGCAVCHKQSDPVGLTLEHFDGLGQLRTLENGTKIDVSADIGGKKIDGAQGLGKLMHDDPRVAACLVRDVYAYGVGRTPDARDTAELEAQTKAFAAAGYRYKSLLTDIAASPGFLRAEPPKGLDLSKPNTVASGPAPQGGFR